MDVVTGSTGCLGNVLVRELLKRDREVKTIIRKTSDTCSIDDCQTERVYGDLTDQASLVRAFDGAENVYHLAAEVTIMPGRKDLIDKINYLGTINVINACRKAGVKRLIFASSIHALKAPKGNAKIDESLPLDLYSKRGQYDRSKAWASKAVLEANGSGLKTCVLCPTAIIGPYDFRLSHLGQFFVDYSKGKLDFIVDGAYDFVDVRDVALGHILACEKGKGGSLYILSGQRVTLGELVKILEDLTGVARPRFKIPTSLAYFISVFTPAYYRITNKKPKFTKYSIMTINANCNISSQKAKTELGYSTRDVRDSIKDTLDWFRQKDML